MIDFDAPYTLSIDGQAASAEAQLAVINPATGAVFARCPAAGSAELDRAVQAAQVRGDYVFGSVLFRNKIICTI